MDGINNYDQSFWARETVSLLALASVKGIGYWTLFNLASSGSTFSQVLKSASFEEFNEWFTKAECRSPKLSPQNWEEFQKEIWTQGNELFRRLKKMEVQVVHFGEEAFPNSLRQIPEPPRWLFVQGNLSILHEPAVAIVGTREPSEDGEFLAKFVGGYIPCFHAVTVSGLATGIDQLVHQQSIRYQTPTIAVLGNGIFLNYPAGSENLRYDICVNQGAVITEYLPNQSYSAENFVRRNRIQAGLANVLIPVEWKSRGGTAHTVRYAIQAKKPVICLQMPDWSEKAHPELNIAKEWGGEVFVAPYDGIEFLTAVRSYLPTKSPSDSSQVSERPPCSNSSTKDGRDSKVLAEQNSSVQIDSKSIHQLNLLSDTLTGVSEQLE